MLEQHAINSIPLPPANGGDRALDWGFCGDTRWHRTFLEVGDREWVDDGHALPEDTSVIAEAFGLSAASPDLLLMSPAEIEALAHARG